MKLKLSDTLVKNIIVVYILLQPIIDVITSILVRNVNEMLTLGIIVRTLFMICVALYSLIVSDKKYRIKLIVYYVAIFVYMLAFIVIKCIDHSVAGLLTQIKGIVKTFYLPIILVALIPIFKKHDIKISNKVFVYSLLGYTAVIFLARVFGVGYRTYPNKEGTFGLFFAANEIGAILTSISPILVLSLINGEKGKVINFITLALYIFSVLEMGTKVPFFGAIALGIISLVICIIRFFAVDKKEYLKKGILVICTIIITFVFVPYSPVGKNVEQTNGVTFPKIGDLFKDEGYTESRENEKKEEESDENQDSIISGRDYYLKDNIERFNESNTLNKIFGIGYVIYDYETPTDLKIVEMDYFDIAICDGLVGFILYFIPFIIMAFYILQYIILNIKKVLVSQDVILMVYSLAICAVVAFLAGHVLNAPASGIFIAVIAIQLLNKLKEMDKERMAEN